MRRKGRKQKRILIICTFSLILFLTIGYAAFETNLNITARGNIKDLSRVIQSWTETSNEDFHTDYYRENIVSATFLDNNTIPDNAVENWNVSVDKTHGGVVAYVVPNEEDNTKYDLYIGAKDGVVANADSSYLFYEFKNLKSIEISDNLDTSNVANMGFMFYHCENITNLDLSTFDTKYVTDMGAMFDGCIRLETLDVSSFDTSNVINMQQMFYGLHALTELDVTNFNTISATNMMFMFYECYNLKSLNLCSFNTSNVTNMNFMFQSASSLENIYVGPSWVTSQASTTDMYTSCGVSDVTVGMCDTVNLNNELENE